MAGARLSWQLEGGYSRFIRGSRVRLRLREGPAAQTLRLSPLSFRKSDPLDLLFELGRGISGGAPGGLGWRVRPGASVRARILFPGNAYLGNFRVPAGRLGIQWSVQAEALASAGRSGSLGLIDAEGRSRLQQVWVSFFPATTPLHKALLEGWKSYRSPQDPAEVLQLEEGQLVRWQWRGRVRLALDFSWSAGPAWGLPGAGRAFDVAVEAGGGPWVRGGFEVLKGGSFTIQLRQEGSGTEFRLRREGDASRRKGFSAGFSVGADVRVKRLGPAQGALGWLTASLSSPARREANRAVRRALDRQLEISLALEGSRWRGRTTLITARWSRPEPVAFLEGYRELLEGRVPRPGAGLRVSGRLEKFQGSRRRVSFNVLNWEWSRSERREVRHVWEVTPAGDVIVERSRQLEKVHTGWQAVQFLKLIEKKGTRSHADWTLGLAGRLSRSRLHEFLRGALRAGALDEFSLPPRSRFPARLEVLILTRFTPKGLEAVLAAQPRARLEAIVRALELWAPQRYGRSTYWRDWIESPPLRRLIERDPVQAHLASRYPVPGRRKSERLQVVAEYRRVRRLLRVLEKPPRERDLLAVAGRGLDLPVFLFFHLLCPRRSRRSAGLVTGEWESVWGDVELLEEFVRP